MNLALFDFDGTITFGDTFTPFLHYAGMICTELEVRDGRMTGRYRQGDCIGKKKARRILEKYTLQDYASFTVTARQKTTKRC